MNLATLIITIVLIFFIVELFLHILILRLSKRFDTILTKRDKYPLLDTEGLEKFFKTGYDPELGWVRKPNTSKTEDSFSGEKSYNINSTGSRVNPGHEKQKTKIITFGDSYTFCREVNDDETWQHYLAKILKCNVSNFGVGNYGLDQALLRFKKEVKNYKDAKHVIIGVVPETIQRNLTMWKHYSEPGNTFGFKPRFILKNNKLVLIPNPADVKEKFLELKKIIQIANKYDHFYEEFKKSLFTFPYTFSILKNPKRNVLLLTSSSIALFFEKVKINWRELSFISSGKIKDKLDTRVLKKESYYKDKNLSELTLAIIKEFNKTAKENKLNPVFMMMPQPDDLEFIKKNKKVYYEDFIKEIGKIMKCIDFGEVFLKLKEPLDIFPSKKYSKTYKVYGGHYSNLGNKLVAEEINKIIKK